MPAYRSSAEADVRNAVVARLRDVRPEGRIIHEINVGTYGEVRMDLLCVSPLEIIAVEIKSARDKLDRLPKQIAAMNGCAHHAVAALHEKHLVEQETNQWMAHEVRGEKFYMRREPEEATGAVTWVFPERRRILRADQRDGMAKWETPPTVFQQSVPPRGLDLLWRDELAWLCGQLRVAASRTSRMDQMAAALRWHCTGAELTRGVCAALRMRECVEADAPIATVARAA